MYHDYIRLFGFDFVLAGNRYHFFEKPDFVEAYNLSIKPSTGSRNKVKIARFYIKTKNEIFHFASPFEVTFEQQFNPHLNRHVGTPSRVLKSNAVLFELGVFSSSDKATGLDLNLGALRLYNDDCFINVKTGPDGLRDIWVKTHFEARLLDDELLPISLRANSNSYFRVFNDNSDDTFRLQFTDNPFTLITKLGIRPRLEKRWQVPHLDAPISKLNQNIEWLFLEDKRDHSDLYLHPFIHPTKDGEKAVLAAIGFECKAIKLNATRNNDPLSPLLIRSIQAIPKPNRLLKTFGMVANSKQGYHRWRVNQPLDLSIRVAPDLDGYHGLLINTRSQPIEIEREDSESAIIGLRREVKLFCDAASTLEFKQEISANKPHYHIDSSINKRVTTPFIKSLLKSISINRPGIALSNGENANVISWQFGGASANEKQALMPLCPDEAMLDPYQDVLTSLLEHCNTAYENLHSDNTPVTHETNLRMRGNQSDDDPETKPSLKSLFYTGNSRPSALGYVQVETLGTMSAPGLGDHVNRYNFGNYHVTRTWSEGEIPEYVALIADKDGNLSENTVATLQAGFAMDPAFSDKGQDILVSALTTRSGLALRDTGNHLVGVVKLGKETSLLDILRKEKVEDVELSEKEKNGLSKQLPSKLNEPSWTGLILFEQSLDLSNFELLESLLPEDFSLNLRFLAVSPDRDRNFATYGLVSWENHRLGDPEPEPPIVSNEELRVQMTRIDITWAARKLTRFTTETRVEYRSFAGARRPLTDGKPNYTRVDVIGSVDKETAAIRFLAQANKPIPLFDEDGGGIGPLKQVSIKQIEITRMGKRTDFNVDGDIDLQPFDLGFDWGFDKADRLKFDGLKFGFLNNLKFEGNWLGLDYPSLRFDFGKGWRLLNFDNFNLELRRIGYDTEDSDFSWGNLLPIFDRDWQLPSIRLGLQLNLGKLPFLTQNPFEDLVFDFELAMPFELDGDGEPNYLKLDLPRCRLALRALGFNKLNLKLMRFLEISAEKVLLENKDPDPLWLFLKKLKLKVLDKTLIEDFTFGHYWADNQKGFIGLLNDSLPEFSLITVEWLLVGRNLVLNGNGNDDLIKAIVSIEPQTEISGESLKDKIDEAYQNNSLIPTTGDHIGEWVFAAGFNMFDEFLKGKFLFHDGAYYGIAIDGPFLRKWFGYDLAISLLYIIKDRPEEDLFRLSLRVPTVSLGGIAFNGGVIVIEIQMNGGFLLDMGYPWLASNGERQWERGFGVMLSGLMGRGGSFVAKRTSIKTRTITGARPGKMTLVEGGQAAMVGIGGDFRAGPLRVTAYAGIYYTCEGGLLFFTPESNKTRLDLVGLRLSGSIGIQARGIAELDWWVISIRVEVVAGAEARLTLFWGALEHHQPGSSDLPAVISGDDKRIGVRVDFVLYARVSARACIGKGWFKVCKGISVGVSMPYRTTLYLS